MASKTQTPSGPVIHPRDLSFRHDPAALHWWLNGDPIATAFYNALSASFPQGERFFMDSVRPYRDVADAGLRDRISAFLAQEAVHSREHLVFNRSLEQRGYQFESIDAYLKARFDFGRKLPKINQLGATMALEHFTAILAHALLSNGDLAGAPPELRDMWEWHAIEEIEHKAVAFDTFLSATQKLSPLRRWWLRSVSMVLSTIMFFQFLIFGVRGFLRKDGLNNLRSWFSLLQYLWVRPGIIRRVAPSYFAYFKPNFHPWQVDDRALIARVEAALTANHAVA